MSDKKPADAPRGAAVIRLTTVAEETAQERLMKKHVPAWVISGAVHVGLIAVLILLFGTRGTTAKPPEKVIDTSAAKEEEPPEKDLTVEDLGVQSNLEAALPEIERVAERTVEAAVTQDNLGQPNAQDIDINAYAPPGVASSDLTTPGAVGDTGNVLQGTGGLGGNINATFGGRSGATKSRLLASGGGNDMSEAAVARGLAWLARQQKPDGNWVFDGTGKEHTVAATGMCLLPFLAAGETHRSGKKYQQTVARGLAWLLKNCPVSGPKAGMMSSNMYAQGIAATALCEAYGMTKDKGLLLAGAQAAVNCIQRAQGPNGSWGYSAARAGNGDTSIVGWQVQALKAAQLGKDIVVDARVVKKATDFLDHASRGSRKAEYGYQDNANARPGTALTAVGLLCRYYIDGWGPDTGGMQEGVAGLMRNGPKPGARLNMYYHYYATQVVHFFEGDDWKDWNEGPKGQDGTRKGGMRDWLIDLQHKKDDPNLGSWDPDSGTIGKSCGRLGTTAMCVLTLEVYYRHLPLYKRNNAGDGALKIVEGAK